MKQDAKRITLPGREEMQKRLVAVNDIPHYQEHLYPRILESADRELVLKGVVGMLMLAFYDYLESMPAAAQAGLYMEAPRFIDALVDDKEAAEQAKAFIEQALQG